MTLKPVSKSVLDILRYLDARRPMTSKLVDKILQDRNYSVKFLESMKEARAAGKDSFSFEYEDQMLYIELVKDFGNLQPA